MSGHYYNRRPQQHRSLTDPYNQSPYPGVNPYTDVPEAGASSLMPYQPQTLMPDPVVEASPAKAGVLGGLAGLGEIKGFIDRMGGIDGMIATFGKVQKVMSSVQQFAPMAKLIMGALPLVGKASNKNSVPEEENYEEYVPARPRRKKTQRKKTTSRRRSTKRRSR